METTLEYLLSVVEGTQDGYTPSPAERQLAEALIALEREEDELSTARQRLHLRLGDVPSPELQHRERELSGRRRDLHQRIDALRAELDNLGWTRTTETSGRTGRAT